MVHNLQFKNSETPFKSKAQLHNSTKNELHVGRIATIVLGEIYKKLQNAISKLKSYELLNPELTRNLWKS